MNCIKIVNQSLFNSCRVHLKFNVQMFLCLVAHIFGLTYPSNWTKWLIAMTIFLMLGFGCTIRKRWVVKIKTKMSYHILQNIFTHSLLFSYLQIKLVVILTSDYTRFRNIYQTHWQISPIFSLSMPNCNFKVLSSSRYMFGNSCCNFWNERRWCKV